MGDVTQILLNAQNPDVGLRTEAERSLENAKSGNFSLFMMTMVTELATEDKPQPTRMLAGLLMKNALFAKNDAGRLEAQQKWLALDVAARDQIKNGCLTTLQSPSTEVRNQACQVVAKIGLAELPEGQWLDVIGILKNCVAGAANAHAKHGALVSLGYICAEIFEAESDCLDSQANDILTAVLQGMRSEEPDNEIKLAAVKALMDALPFAEKNFEAATERNYIMQQLCACTQVPDMRVRKEAMDCLAEIAYHYYRHLKDYMQVVGDLTMKCIKDAKAQPEIATAAMEFWTTIAEEEIGLQSAIEDGAEDASALLNITTQAAPFFVPVLLECLTMKDGDEDDDTWTISKAAAVCLTMFSQSSKDDVVQHVMPFVNTNVTQQNWILKDAACLAFGSILDGPSVETLKPYVIQAASFFLTELVNQATAVQVRDTCAWVISMILEFCPFRELISEDLLNKLMQCLQDEPRVAVHGCYAFSQLVAFVEGELEDDEPQTTSLSPVTPQILQRLVETANRPDADEMANGYELFTNAYSTLADLVRVSGKDMQSVLVQLIPVIVQKLRSSFQGEIAEDKNFCHSVQSQCCAVINALANKIPTEYLVQIDPATNLSLAHQMMEVLIHVFQSKNAEVHEEALMAVSAVALAVSQNFAVYMDAFKPHLLQALSNKDDYQVCAAAVGVVGDLSRALEKQFAPHCDEVVHHLLTLCLDSHLQRDVKPPILSTFGDIALAIGGDFAKYVEHTMTMLFNASQMEVQADDEDSIEYVNKLRENILEGYSGTIQAMRDADKIAGGNQHVTAMQTYYPNIVYLLHQRIHAEAVVNADTLEEGVLKASLNLLGDLAQAGAKQYFVGPWIQDILTKGQQMELDQEDVQFAARIL